MIDVALGWFEELSCQVILSWCSRDGMGWMTVSVCLCLSICLPVCLCLSAAGCWLWRWRWRSLQLSGSQSQGLKRAEVKIECQMWPHVVMAPARHPEIPLPVAARSASPARPPSQHIRHDRICLSHWPRRLRRASGMNHVRLEGPGRASGGTRVVAAGAVQVAWGSVQKLGSAQQFDMKRLKTRSLHDPPLR